MLVAVGNVTISWAGAERVLDELIAWHQHNNTDLSRDHPRGLDNKLKYLKFMQDDVRFLPGVRTWLRDIRLEMKRLGVGRHHIIHGMLSQRGLLMEWTTQRISYQGPSAFLRHHRFSNDELMQLTKDIANLIADLAPKVWLLIGRDPTKFPAEVVTKAVADLGLYRETGPTSPKQPHTPPSAHR